MGGDSVTVLLSVTDRAELLGEFLDSLRAQRGVQLKLRVRVDQYETAHDVDRALSRFGCDFREDGPALGLPLTYLSLLGSAGDETEFYAFADQDDRWHPDKLNIACAALSEKSQGRPALWICGYEPFGEILSQKPQSGNVIPSAPATLAHALVENIGPGCTMVWNKQLQDILSSRIPASGILMHDFWVYLVAAAVGEVVVDDRPLVSYRLHGGNAVGIDRSIRSRTKRLLRTIRGGTLTLESQADALLIEFGDLLQADDYRLCQVMAAGKPWTRTRYVVAGRFRRERRVDNFFLVLRLLLPARRLRDSAKRRAQPEN